MRNCWTSVVFAGAVCGLSTAAGAADKPLSYAVDGACYCNLTAATPLSNEIVATPVGGQSVQQVCARIGDGPTLKKSAGKYNFPVFDDMQCGHGPGPDGFTGMIDDAGTGISTGPKWDLATAYKKKLMQSVAANDSSTEPKDEVKVSSSKRFKPRYVQAPSANAPKAKTAQAKVSTERDSAEISTAVVRIKPVMTEPKLQSAKGTTEPAQAKVVESKPVITEAPKVVEAPKVIATEPVNKPVTVTHTVTASVEEPVAEPEAIEKSAEVVSEEITTTPSDIPTNDAELATASNALRLPSATRASSQEFNYLSITPAGYDFGGSGVKLAASASHGDKAQTFLRLGFANTYREAAVGASYFFTLPQANRMTFVLSAGLELGRFLLSEQNVDTVANDTGAFVEASSRIVLNNRFEFQAGVGFSSFFEGDPHAFGAARYHLTRQMDLTGEFEVGDNDSLGLGIRYYY